MVRALCCKCRSHLAAKAKNLAGVLSLGEVLEVLKLFASVRVTDTELYLALSGELPETLCSRLAKPYLLSFRPSILQSNGPH